MDDKEKSIEMDIKEEEAESKISKKRIIIIITILLIALILLTYFFFFQYNSSKNRIKGIFEKFYDLSDEEPSSGSFSDLIDACDGKEIGDSCEIELNEGNKEGICSLSGENNLVCINN